MTVRECDVMTTWGDVIEKNVESTGTNTTRRFIRITSLNFSFDSTKLLIVALLRLQK